MFAQARAQSRCQTMCASLKLTEKKLLEVDGGHVPQAAPLEDCYLDPKHLVPNVTLVPSNTPRITTARYHSDDQPD